MPVTATKVPEPIISSLESQASLGVMMTDQGPLPLKSVAIDAHIDQLFAGVKVRQGYVNTHQDTIEATYIFPLPDRAAVTRFQAKLGDRLIEGILKERGTARQEYEEAIQQGHRAAIAEEERPNVFTMRVGNILPGESAEIELSLCMPLAYEEGEATLRFPLVVAPRYIPGTPLEDAVGLGTSPDTDTVPDASRITPPVLLPGYPYPVQLDIAVSLAQEITQPKINMPVRFEAGTGSHTRWQVIPGQKLDRDFLFRFPVASDTISTQAMIAPDQNDPSQGTVSITIVPPKPSAQVSKPKPRRIVFVLDRSGSMEGWKLIAARRALGRMIDTLSPRDHFAILVFDDSVDRLPNPKIEPAWYSGADTQRFRAIEALSSIRARGGTELSRPLIEAIHSLNAISAEEDRILVLITDGQVGNENLVIKQLAAIVSGQRIFTLGIDKAVNEGFLRQLAALGGGCMELVESEERLDAVMQRIHRRIAAPVLRHVSWIVDGLQMDAADVVPDQIPDLFAEAPLVIQGRCNLSAKGTITLTATDDAGNPWKQTLSPVLQNSDALALCWARTKIRQLEDRHACGKEKSEMLIKEIVRLSVKHQVLSRFTAYLAVDCSSIANPNGKPREIVQAVEIPAGWEKLSQPVFACMSTPKRALQHPVRSRKLEGFLDSALRALIAAHGPDSERIPNELMTSIDHTSYRIRAGQIVTETKTLIGSDPAAAWRKFLLKLQELLDDLHSVNSTDAHFQQMNAFYQQWQAAQSESEKLVLQKKLLDTLELFASATSSTVAQNPPPEFQKKSRLQFWK